MLFFSVPSFPTNTVFLLFVCLVFFFREYEEEKEEELSGGIGLRYLAKLRNIQDNKVTLEHPFCSCTYCLLWPLRGLRQDLVYYAPIFVTGDLTSLLAMLLTC